MMNGRRVVKRSSNRMDARTVDPRAPGHGRSENVRFGYRGDISLGSFAVFHHYQPGTTMISIKVDYKGELLCQCTHEPSGSTLMTDAPKDNFGNGSTFSPTDLCATSLLSCMVTTMGIAAKKAGFELGWCEAVVTKVMTAVHTRRIGSLPVVIRLRDEYSEDQIRVLHHAAETCPVKESLSPGIDIPIVWERSA